MMSFTLFDWYIVSYWLSKESNDWKIHVKLFWSVACPDEASIRDVQKIRAYGEGLTRGEVNVESELIINIQMQI